MRRALGVSLLAVLFAGIGCASPQAWFEAPPDREIAKTAATGSPPAKRREVFREAVELVSRMRYAEADEKLRSILDAFIEAGDVEYASRTLFWLGYVAEKQNRLADAESYYYRVVAQYPQSQAAEQAAMRLEMLYGR